MSVDRICNDSFRNPRNKQYVMTSVGSFHYHSSVHYGFKNDRERYFCSKAKDKLAKTLTDCVESLYSPEKNKSV